MHMTTPPFQVLLCTLLATLFFFTEGVEGAETAKFTGWEKGSQYNGFYNYKERDTLKGSVTDFRKITPLPGMDPGAALIIDEGGSEILVHVCPLAYADLQKIGIRKGVKTKISGSWANISGKDVFLAAKIKQGDTFEYKIRLSKDGTPFWTLSPEEREKEEATGKD